MFPKMMPQNQKTTNKFYRIRNHWFVYFCQRSGFPLLQISTQQNNYSSCHKQKLHKKYNTFIIEIELSFPNKNSTDDKFSIRQLYYLSVIELYVTWSLTVTFTSINTKAYFRFNLSMDAVSSSIKDVGTSRRIPSYLLHVHWASSYPNL